MKNMESYERKLVLNVRCIKDPTSNMKQNLQGKKQEHLHKGTWCSCHTIHHFTV